MDTYRGMIDFDARRPAPVRSAAADGRRRATRTASAPRSSSSSSSTTRPDYHGDPPDPRRDRRRHRSDLRNHRRQRGRPRLVGDRRHRRRDRHADVRAAAQAGGRRRLQRRCSTAPGSRSVRIRRRHGRLPGVPDDLVPRLRPGRQRNHRRLRRSRSTTSRPSPTWIPPNMRDHPKVDGVLARRSSIRSASTATSVTCPTTCAMVPQVFDLRARIEDDGNRRQRA